VLEAGCGRLAGTSYEKILRHTSDLLENRDAYEKMAQAKNPFGDGHAAARIAAALEQPPSKRQEFTPAPG
jgi:UDP-N-acetylglucosamine 2-epimerase (non-hydrolysing)